MINRLQLLLSCFMPANVVLNARESFQYHTVITLSLLVGSSGFPFIWIFMLMGHGQEALVVGWSFLIFYLIPLGVKYGISLPVASHLISANYLQCHIFLCVFFGGVSAPNAMWLIGSPLIAILTGGYRHGVIWAITSSLTIMILFFAEFTGQYEFISSLTFAEHLLIHSLGMIGLLFATFGSAASYELLRLTELERRQHAEQELLKAHQELKDRDQQKTTFFQNISHELRTPLTLILNPIDSMRQQLPEHSELAMIERNARRLLRLVNQLLDFQKVEAGKRTLKLEYIDLAQLSLECGSYFNSSCLSKGIDFYISINGSIVTQSEIRSTTQQPLWVKADLDSLEIIIFNFLSNALKFTSDGGQIELGVQTLSDGVHLFVRDTGVGIPKETQKYLFEVFTQLEHTSTRSFEGSGLGLALSKALTEQLGGQVGVTSELGKGSTFWSTFPQIKADSVGHSSSFKEFEVRTWLLDEQVVSKQPHPDHDRLGLSKENPLESNSSIYHIHVIDDLEDMRMLLGRFLTKAGYRVSFSKNGQQGLELIQQDRPDLIITDLMMPTMSGSQFINELRHLPVYSDIPVILLTATSDGSHRLQVKNDGADVILGKPFNRRELLRVTESLLFGEVTKDDDERQCLF